MADKTLLRDLKDLGPVQLETFKNRDGYQLQSYQWNVQNAKATVIAIHGITSHAKFEYLHHENDELQTDTQQRYVTYTNSWPETFNKEQYNFCCIDLQGHGNSEGWGRCNVEAFDDFAMDVLHFAIHLNNNSTHLIPNYLLGISMGGGVVARTAQLFRFIQITGTLPKTKHDRGLLDKFPNCLTTPLSAMNPSSTEDEEFVNAIHKIPLQGIILLSPNISLVKVLSQGINRYLLPFSGPISTLFPHLKVASLARNNRFPWIEMDRILDSGLHGIYNSRLPARIAQQNVVAGQKVLADIPLLCDFGSPSSDSGQKTERITNNFRFLIFHSPNDTLADFEGSQKLFIMLKDRVSTIHFFHPEQMWHYLTLEPGNLRLRDEILLWMKAIPNDLKIKNAII